MAVTVVSHYRIRAAIALAGVALIAVIGGAVRVHFFRPGPKVAGPPMRIVPIASGPGMQSFNARFSPDGNRIAFAYYGDTDYNTDIYVKQIGAEKTLRLTTDPAKDESPTWSPDGRYIAFHRSGDGKQAIYVIPAVGGLERKLLTSKGSSFDISSMDWSPDGKHLAYVEGEPGERIFLLAVDNPKDNRPLTTPAGLQVAGYFPRFSPDGQEVAFVRSAETRDIWVVRTVGGQPKRLTFDDAFIYGLDWTPDGAYIVFSSVRSGGSPRLWKVRASGGQPEPLSMPPDIGEELSLSRHGRRLAYTQREWNSNIWRYELPRSAGQIPPPTKLVASTGLNSDAQYSPDGTRIAFQSSRSGAIEIWVCESDGSNPRQVTFLGCNEVSCPRWSPDGTAIVFSAPYEGRDAVYIVSAEGGQPRRLTTHASHESTPSWSRDGKWIYFGSDRSGAWQVWKVPPNGGNAVQVTKKGGFAALESRDGKTLYYAKRLKFPGYRKVQGLWKVQVEGGEETLVLKELAAGLYDCWDLTGEGIYFYDDSRSAIEFFSFATHKETPVARSEKRGGPLALSPDDRWILFSQVDLDTSHIMMVENFHW
jgi:Tol biopolymer transport system component